MNQVSSSASNGKPGIPHALLILAVFFFFLPWAFRAGRLSLGQKENDVKDWLPSDFPETAELEWFANHFAGESFVLATWPGCTVGDQRLKLFERKLLHESESYQLPAEMPPEEADRYRRAREVGKELQLLDTGTHFLNWGGQDEKWLKSAAGPWYYITPDGRLYRWDESTNGPASAVRAIARSAGLFELEGQFVTGFSAAAGQRINPFYNDPSLLTAPLFRSVQTGETVLAELAVEGGPLWPIDLTDESLRETVARRRATERLTGTLFAPAITQDFPWTVDAFREAIPEPRRDDLPENFDALVRATLIQIVRSDYDGDLQALKDAPINEQTDAWYAVYDAAEVEPPPRLTCVLVTLTDLAKDNLSFALGRGVLGQPRGRLLQLAEQSGVYPAPTPSLAPPPFNRPQPVAAVDMPPLRLGGPPVDNMAIDEEGTITLVRLVGYSVVLGIVLSYLCFGSLKITVMVFIVGGASAILSMAMVWWTSGRVDAVLMSMPSLVYVLGLSGAIHVVNYYRDEVRLRGEQGAARRALKHALLPCTLASVTTAIGLISLFTSNLAPISNFGLYSAIGVIAMLAVLFSYLPAALQVFTPKISRLETDTELNGELPPSRLSEAWASVGRFITTHHAYVSVSCLLILLAGSIGLANLTTSVQLLKLFDEDSRIIDDYTWLEENFGKLVPMELIVRVPPRLQSEVREDQEENAEAAHEATASAVASLNVLERVEVVSRIRTVVYRTLGEPGRGIVGQAMGADTFLPPLPAPTNSYSPVRARFNRELAAASDQLRSNDYLRIEESGDYEDSELWRISLRVAALSDVDYGRFIATLRKSVEPVLRAYDTRQALLESLTNDEDDRRGNAARVMIVGSDNPRSLSEAALVQPDGSIDQAATYVATLGELLRGERIAAPRWLNVTAEKAIELKQSEQWERLVQRFDAIIWLGHDGFQRSDFAATTLIDGQTIFQKQVEPTLLPGRIPDVRGSGPLQVVYTGVIPVVYKAQRTLLNSLANSIGLAFVLIAAVMVWLLNPGRFPTGWMKPRNLAAGMSAGMVAMIPNVFPVLLVFGVMSHLGIEIDIGTMMTASVAMGVAVDDTIHFLAWFREHLDRGLDRVAAVIETYRRVGPAMTQTTIVGGLGLFVFALSTFTPTQRFGTLMLVMLSTALIGDLILLPALLAGPAGRFFKPRERAKRSDKSSQTIEGESNKDGETISPSDSDDANNEPFKVHFQTERKDGPHRVRNKPKQ